MARYALRRVAGMIPILLGTTLVIFVAVWALPGDPIQALAGPTQVVSPSVEAVLRERYHLDDPLITQYWRYLQGLLTGDLGVDLQGREVAATVGRAWPVTLRLGLTAWAMMGIAGLALGTAAGMRPGGRIDWLVLSGTTLILGVPYFVLAFVVQYVFGVELGWLPTSGIRQGWPVSYLLPASVLATFGVPEVARLTRAAILENRTADYVDTATSRGLPRRRIVIRHILRNSLVPVVSLLGLSLGYMVSGTVLIEGIYNVPGLGYTIFTAIGNQNGPVVVGISTLLVGVYLLVNLFVDLAYGLLDPRISLVRHH